MTYHYKKYEWTAFTEADFLGQGGNGSSIGCGDSFTMPASATVCMSTYDNDRSLSGDNYCNENANDHSGQKATVDGARVGSQMYAECYHVLKGSDGKTYYMIEIEIEGYDAPGAGSDFFTFYGAVPPAGVELSVVNTCNVKGHWVDYKCLGAGEKAPANEPPTFTNVPDDGILCVDENTTFVIDLNADDPDGDTLTYEIVGGRDAAFFEIDPATGELTFNAPQDYENPQSGGNSNTYDVTVKVSDGNGGSETKPLWVKVKDVDENPVCESVGPNLIVNGDFEDNALHSNKAWGLFCKIPGWKAVVDKIEVQEGNYGTGNAYGNAVVELDADRNATIQQKVDLDEAGTYRFSVDYAMRGTDAGTNGFEVVINGQVQSTVRPTQPGFQTLTFDIDLPAGTNCIELRGIGTSDCIGTVVDNVKLQQVTESCGSVSGRYFCDDNDNGVDDGEPGIAGATVWLMREGTSNNNEAIASTTTDADGNYTFDDVAPGNYFVRFENPDEVAGAEGKVFIAADQGNDDAIDSDVTDVGGIGNGNTDVFEVGAGEDVTDVDGGIKDPGTASLEGRVFCDDNDDSIDNGEVGVGGVRVVLTTAAGAFVAETTTSADGSYSFIGLDAGDYKVTFDESTAGGKTLVDSNVGGDDTVDSDADQATGMTGVYSLAIGETVSDVDAGVEDPGTASLEGRVFCDDNDDSIDNGEDGVGGVRVVLTTAAGAFVAETTTSADGSYSFIGLDAGDYKVTFDESTAGGKTLVDSNVGGDDTVDSDADQATGMTGVYSLAIGENVTDVDAGVEVGNTDPEAQDDAGKICANEELMINVLDNDSDADGDALTVTAVNGVAISNGQTIDLDGVFVTLTDGKLSFDAEDALVGLNIGEETTITYSYTVEDGNGGSDVADIAATFCGVAETVAEVCASLPDSTSYQIVTGIPDVTDPATWSDIAFDIQLSGSGDARLDGVVFTEAFCLSESDPAVGGATFAEAPVWTADLYCADPAELPSGFFNDDQIGSNGEAAIDNLDLINYILNQDYTDNGFTGFEVQSAVWALTDDFDFDTFLDAFDQFGDAADVQTIIDDAIANGEGFQAGAGDVIGLILDPNPATDENSQPFIIGVEFDSLDCLC